MALDSKGGASEMFGTKTESLQEDGDLEDGEIASDEEEPLEKGITENLEEKSDSKIFSPVAPLSEKFASHTPEDSEFEKDLRKLREEVERKKNKKEVKKRRDNEKEISRKRKLKISEDGKSEREKKRKTETNKCAEKIEEDLNEDELLGLCVRGASPTINLDQIEVWSGKQPINDPDWQFHDKSENESDLEERDDRKKRRKDKDRRGFKGSSREDREIKKRLQMKRKGKNRKDMDNSDMICINFMKGNCNKGNDCLYSHAICPPKKMELCKFYLMDCCAKRDKCLYLHEEFPCKFFHTGLKCYSGKKCKFSHDPLNSLSKDILLKHLETAPKEILGDFPRLSRDCAETMVNSKTTGKAMDTTKIPSLFDIQVSIPLEYQNSGEKNEDRTTPPCSPPPNLKTSPKTKQKELNKFYSEDDSANNERAQQIGSPLDFAKELEAYKNQQLHNKGIELKKTEHFHNCENSIHFGASSSQSLKFESKLNHENDVCRRNQEHKEDSFDEIENEKEGKKRRRKYEEKRNKKNKKKEIENDIESGNWKKFRKNKNLSKKTAEKPDAMDDSPAVRLNEDGSFGGIKFKIINRKEIRKSSDSDKDVLLPMKIEKPNEFLSSDDERPLNYLVKNEKSGVIRDGTNDEIEKFGVEIKPDVEDETDENEPENPLIIETNDDPEDDEKSVEPSVPKHLPKKQRELFLRIQAQNQKIKAEKKRKEANLKKNSTESGTESEGDFGRTPSPEPADENWYSSDDEDSTKKDNQNICIPNSGSKDSNYPSVQIPTASPTKPKIEIPAFSGPDLSKINITELLSSIRQVTSKKSQSLSDEGLKPTPVPSSTSYEITKVENPLKINYFNSNPEKKEVKDPRLRDPRINPDCTKRASLDKPIIGKTIYDSANFKTDFRDLDLRFQSKFDSDERLKNLESVVPFGDVDLRTFGGPSENPDSDFDMRKFGLPFKPVPVHSAATEIDASLNSHSPINYKVETILIPRPDFSSIKISPSDPQVKRDPRLRRLFRINSSENEPKEEQKKSGLPSDPRQRKPVASDTPKSPPQSPFSPKQNESVLGNQGLLNTNLLLLAQLGLSAAAAGTNVFDPRIQQLLNKSPQELDLLRNQLANIKTQSDFDLFRSQLISSENPEVVRSQSQGLLPTPIGGPSGVGLLGPAPGFLMSGMAMPDPSVIMPPLGSIGPNTLGFDPRFATGCGEDDIPESEPRHFNRGGFRNDRRGRGNWRGNRERNWDRESRRHNKRDDRDRMRHNRDRDDRREKKRSDTPD